MTRYKLFHLKSLCVFQVNSTLKCKYVKWHCLALMWKLISYLTIYLKMLVLLSMKIWLHITSLRFSPRRYIKIENILALAAEILLQQIIISIWSGELKIIRFLSHVENSLGSAYPTFCKTLRQIVSNIRKINCI